MFTVEIDWDETAVTVLDQSGEHEDVQFLLYEDAVYIRQFDNDSNRHTVIEMSPDQFHELMTAMDLPDGAYLLGDKND